MKFDRFNQLAIGNRMVLLMAIDLLMQNGREFIQNTEKEELISGMKRVAGNLVAANVLTEVVVIAKDLARLRTCELLEYVKCSALTFTRPDQQEPGICPVCGSTIEHEVDSAADEGGFYRWSCPECGARGKAGYEKVFDRHFDVTDRDGKPLQSACK